MYVGSGQIPGLSLANMSRDAIAGFRRFSFLASVFCESWPPIRPDYLKPRASTEKTRRGRVRMATTSKSLQKYFRTVNEANAALAQRWQAITHHLSLGLGVALPTAVAVVTDGYCKLRERHEPMASPLSHRPQGIQRVIAEAEFDRFLSWEGLRLSLGERVVSVQL